MRSVEQQANDSRERARSGLNLTQQSTSRLLQLSDLERAVVLFENQWRPGQGRRKQEIEHRFGFGVTTFLAHLDRAILKPEAENLAPSVVNRRRSAMAQRHERASERQNELDG